ncbi:MAG: hypothetical protein ACYDCC_13410 [Actinomycetota bacterium]
MLSKCLALVLFSTLLVASQSSQAATQPSQHSDITIDWDGELDAAHGVVSGDGSVAHPYVISGWMVSNISIKDTTRAITIENDTIGGTLRLNWLGEHIKVLDNSINDLRVNENIPRWGNATIADIEHNTFGVVGQLRHFDGVFAHNTVGTPLAHSTYPAGKRYPDTEAVNFDGFNGSHFYDNTIYGYVVARLHGHHHSSGYGMPSHNHNGGPDMMEQPDHTKRYDEVTINNNTIYSSGAFALEYVDTNHAANDRTANSETNPYLNAPHTHFTRVHLLNNILNGSGILVDVFNAQDVNHVGTPRGTLEIIGNTITLDRDLTHPLQTVNGIEVLQARYLRLNIDRNTITGAAPLTGTMQLDSEFQKGAGVMLDQLDHAVVSIMTNSVSNRDVGVQATMLTSSVKWSIDKLSTQNVVTPVSYDSSVANPPTVS